ncbi:uncharacterized protein LOC144557968 [Carex rostrata]
MPMQSALVTTYGFILNLLGSLLREELGLLYGFKAELEKLESVFTRIQSVLEDAMTRQLQDRALQDWLEKLTNIAYHAEDVLEEFNFEVLRRKTASRDGRCREVRDFFSGNNQLKFRLLMAHKIKDLREKMDSFSKEVSQFKLKPGALQRPLENMDERVTHSFVESADVIGRDEERKRIVVMLLSAVATSDFSVIAIVGVGGLGKTTLAQLVYTDITSELDRYFNLKIWICVSDNFVVSRLLKSIILQTTGKNCEVDELDQLQRKVREVLHGKRFLLVLDDVWNEEPEKWEKLKILLRSNVSGSKVLVTTHSLKVSTVMGSSENLQLSPLPDNICWVLFQRRAFESGVTPSEPFVEVGKKIVQKCAGIPLAAQALGSLLFFKHEVVDWRKVLESEMWELYKPETGELMPVLKLSYDHLSPQAKQCFAFCSLFPKAYEMEKETLIWQWTSNGFVLDERDGFAIFNDLFWRCFFLEAKMDDDGQVRKCKLHDLMHDLARWVAGKHLCTVTKDISGDTINKKTYHLLIDEWSSKSGMIKKTKKAKSLRTLLISRCNPIEKSFLSRIFAMLRCLRVLDLSSSQIKVIPDSVGCLIHLRYLDLSCSSIESLPQSIGYLLNLQVLKLPKTKIKKLPESLTKLQSLRHLDIRGCIFLTDMPVGVKKLTQLQTLTDFTIGVKKTSCGLGELKELNLTGELFIWHLENFKTEDTQIEHAILSNKEDLVSLRLTWHHRSNSTSNNDSERALNLLRPHENLKRLQLHSYNGLKFPPWLSDSLLTSLVEVKLAYCTKCEHLPSFGGIASLKDLQIIGMHEVRQISGEFYGTGRVKGFPSLEKLAFYDMPKLEEWSVLELMPFSQLTMLTIGMCRALRSIPWVQNIQKLDLSHCSSSLLASLPNTSNLPVLSSLLMDNIQGLTFLPDGFLLCFSSLRKLIVCSCEQLKHLPLIDMQQLVTLQSLEIFDCHQLNSLAFNAVQLTCLRNLNIRNCRSLESLPQNWTGITSLQSISIADCRNITSWTEMDIEGLSSVSDFSLEICNNKRNVSGWLRHLTNLQTLTIHGGHDNRHPQPGKLIMGNSLSICCCGNGLDTLLQGLSNASSLEHLRIRTHLWYNLTRFNRRNPISERLVTPLIYLSHVAVPVQGETTACMSLSGHHALGPIAASLLLHYGPIEYGGGGHRNASSFMLPVSDFEKWKKSTKRNSFLKSRERDKIDPQANKSTSDSSMPMKTALVAATVSTTYGFILNLLSSLLREELSLLSGFKAELEKLESVFTRIRSVLEDAMTRQLQDRALQDWLEKLTDVACHAEDVLDEFNFEVLRRKTASYDGCCREVRDFFSGNNQLKFRCLMAHKIKDLREKMDSFSQEVSQFKLESGVSQRPLQNMDEPPRVTHSFVKSADVIGREEERKRIVAMLLSAAATSENFSVITIVGVGGVGKTTLVQLVYTDSTSELDSYFNLKIWICVSDNFDVSRLLKSIIELTTGKKCEVNELDLLQNKVRGLLCRKRFFLVLDDVWNEEQKKWDDLKVLLRSCLRGSKIVITTRSLKVSSVMGSSENLQLSRLPDDISWKLFQSRAFEDGATPIEPFVAIGKEIVKKCAGIPLAARALGSLLRFKSEVVNWREILESEMWELFKSKPGELMPVLRLSYDHLSPQAKQCFAFCSLFPKAYEMEREVLIWQWTSNGFLLDERDGYEIFNDLLWRCFFLEAKTDDDGHVRKCKLHDLMHDLARWVAGKHFSSVNLMHDTATKDISGNTINKTTYHLLINECSSSLDMIEETKKAKSLRTLLILRCNPIEKSFLSRIFVMLRCLRVLDLSSSQIKVIPDSVGCLIHLRYLDLSCSLIELLPQSIGCLLNLQVLKLPKTKIKKLPESLTKLQSLRHLDIRGCIFLTDMPVGVARLTHLQTLTDFTVGDKKTSCALGELKDLNLSGELFIFHLENFKTEDTEIEHTILSNKQNLVSLRLTWYHHNNSASNNDSERALNLLRPHENLKRLQLHSYNGLKFPPWLSDSLLTSLVEVKLTYCTKCEHLPSFGGIASLKDLQIIGMHEVWQIRGDFYGTGLVKGFPSLEKLSFSDMPKLVEWPILEVMPFSQLSMLTIGRCSALRSIPWVQSLQKLDLSHCNPSLLESLPNTSNLPALSSLLIDNIQGLAFLPDGFLLCFSSLRKLIVCSCVQLEHLPLIDMQQLVTLQSLEIFDCPQLNSLAFNAVQLTCLRNLNIRNCRSLESLPQNWTGITSLQSISIADCQNVTSWTEMDIEGLSSVSDFSLEICNNKRNVSGWLRHLTNLKTLTIHGGHDNRHPQPGKLFTGNSFTICCCDNGLDTLLQGLSNASSLEHLRLEHISGTALPDSIGEIQSLKDLSIYDSPAVASLPDSLRRLTGLEGLWIRGCPVLERRCQRNTGDDWSIISHVRIISIVDRNLTPGEPETRGSRSCGLVCNCCQFRIP